MADSSLSDDPDEGTDEEPLAGGPTRRKQVFNAVGKYARRYAQQNMEHLSTGQFDPNDPAQVEQMQSYYRTRPLDPFLAADKFVRNAGTGNKGLAGIHKFEPKGLRRPPEWVQAQAEAGTEAEPAEGDGESAGPAGDTGPAEEQLQLPFWRKSGGRDPMSIPSPGDGQQQLPFRRKSGDPIDRSSGPTIQRGAAASNPVATGYNNGVQGSFDFTGGGEDKPLGLAGGVLRPGAAHPLAGQAGRGGPTDVGYGDDDQYSEFVDPAHSLVNSSFVDPVEDYASKAPWLYGPKGRPQK